MKIIVINGQGGSGKTSFAQFAKESNYPVYNFSTIDYVKEQAKKLGWTGAKDNKSRRFLSDLKDAFTLYNDMPYQSVIEKIKNVEDNAIVFVDSREPRDISRWVEETNAQTLCIRRPDIEGEEYGNHADDNVFNYDYNYVYCNDKGLKDFKKDAIKFTNWIGSKSWTSHV